ncbi:MAG: Gfo/Idh/MocA family oxidoreductase [Intrasporangium sp.]|nr:Gfo/Idh/MocA family oxidoreductase [Intrasporangium sp.]MDN5797970.1 Gfo/Idh/MocA family oxidoreductase [Intrasporangium sp.]
MTAGGEGRTATDGTRPHRAAVVGCGDVATVHLEAIDAIDGIELVALCDRDPDALARAAAGQDVPGFADVEAMIRQTRPDVVHVCTPHDEHVPVALAALATGTSVLVEKPLAHVMTAAEQLVRAAEDSSVKIGVCLQNRYNTTSQAARTVLDSGELGRVIGATATVMWTRTPDYYRAKPWRGRWERAGGGLLINQALHTIDLLQWLIGDVVDVSGQVATRVYGDVIEVEDTAEMVLRHEGGARSVFFGTLCGVVNHPVTMQITAERGTLSLDGDLTISYADGRVEHVAERAAPSAGRTYWGVSHEVLIADFYDRLGDPEPFWISPSEALKSLRIVTDVYARKG